MNEVFEQNCIVKWVIFFAIFLAIIILIFFCHRPTMMADIFTQSSYHENAFYGSAYELRITSFSFIIFVT